MLLELKRTQPDLNIEILGLNRIGDSAYNNLAIAGRRLPWLQDTAQATVWDRWKITYRDVRILDSQNRLYAVFNLTEHDLALADNRSALRQLFMDGAKVVDSDADQLPDDWELQYFGHLAALPGADPDGDGRDNFSEFAFGTNPADAKSFSSLYPSLAFGGEQSVLSVPFRRRAGAILDYVIEASSDLKYWTARPTEIAWTQDPRNLFDGTGTAEAVCTLTKAAGAGRIGFLRIRAVPRSLR